MNLTGCAFRPSSWSSGLVALVLLTSGVGVSRMPLFADEEKPSDEAETPATEIEAIGEPSTYRRPADGAIWFVWRTGDEWHVHTKTKSAKHEFKGKITIQGGRITKVSDFGGNETKAKKKKGVTRAADDVGRVNDAKNQIDFTFHTAGKEDGFTFTVDKKVKTVTFDLKIDGNHRKDQVRIGAKDVHPSKVPFVISMPEKEPPKKEGEK